MILLLPACSSQFLTDGRTCSPALSCSTPFTIIHTLSSLQQADLDLAGELRLLLLFSRHLYLYYSLAHTQQLSRLRSNPHTRERTRSPFRQEGNLLTHRADVCMIFHSRLSVILRLDRGKSFLGHQPFKATSTKKWAGSVPTATAAGTSHHSWPASSVFTHSPSCCCFHPYITWLLLLLLQNLENRKQQRSPHTTETLALLLCFLIFQQRSTALPVDSGRKSK